jgi:hypothetical protein
MSNSFRICHPKGMGSDKATYANNNKDSSPML